MFSGIGFTGFIVLILGTIFFTMILTMIFRRREEDVIERIETMGILTSGDENKKLKQKSLLERVYMMIEERVLVLFRKQLERGSLAPLEMKLAQGNMAHITPTQHRAKVFIFAALGLLIGILTKNPQLIFVLGFVGFYYPNFKLKQKIDERKLQLKSEIPDFLDLLAATAPSAKTTEDAIRKVCERTEGQITDEFETALDQVNAGKRLRDALNGFAARCGVPEIDVFVSQVNQSEVFGTPIEKTLSAQAEKMRKLKRHVAELKAKKATMTLAIPGVLLLITVVIVIIGPHIVEFMGSMSNFS